MSLLGNRKVVLSKRICYVGMSGNTLNEMLQSMSVVPRPMSSRQGTHGLMSTHTPMDGMLGSFVVAQLEVCVLKTWSANNGRYERGPGLKHVYGGCATGELAQGMIRHGKSSAAHPLVLQTVRVPRRWCK